MINKSIIILCLLLAATVHGQAFELIGTGVVASALDCTGYKFKWEANSTTAECYDADDGGTVTLTGVSIAGGVATIDTSTDKIYFPATNGNNVSTSAMKITIRYRSSGAVPAWVSFWSHDNTTTFYGSRDSSSSSAIRYNMNAYVSINPGVNIYDGSWHVITFEHKQSTPLRKICVDGTCAESSASFTLPSASSGNMYIGSDNDQDLALIGDIDYVYIE